MGDTGAVVRIGGQALADGVLMRTSRAWAVARDDGSVEVGALPALRLAEVPVLRVIAGLAAGFRLAVGRGMLGRGSARAAGRSSSRRRNLRFLWVLGGVEATAVAFSVAVGGRALSPWATVGVTLAPWIVALALLRVGAPASLWRYHGAEHKAVAAHEAGVAMDDLGAVLAAPRVHDRCGTNLVFLGMLGALALTALPGLAQLPGFVLLLGTTAEVVSLAAGRPRSAVSRLVLAGGRAIQRWVTTAEPTADEQAVGCRALAACLAHHHRLAGTAAPAAAEVRAAA